MTETASTAQATVSDALNFSAEQRAQGPQHEMNPERVKNKEAYDQRVADIRNHPDLSEEAKKRYLAEAYAILPGLRRLPGQASRGCQEVTGMLSEAIETQAPGQERL